MGSMHRARQRLPYGTCAGSTSKNAMEKTTAKGYKHHAGRPALVFAVIAATACFSNGIVDASIQTRHLATFVEVKAILEVCLVREHNFRAFGQINTGLRI